MNGFDIIRWYPNFSNETFLSDIQIEHVQSVVNGFDFPDFYEPAFNVFGGCYQNTMPLVKNKSIKGLLLMGQMSKMGSNKLKQLLRALK